MDDKVVAPASGIRREVFLGMVAGVILPILVWVFWLGSNMAMEDDLEPLKNMVTKEDLAPLKISARSSSMWCF